MFEKKKKITVVFKSGFKQVFFCKAFTVQRDRVGRQVVGFEWEDIQPKVLRLDVDDVALVVEE